MAGGGVNRVISQGTNFANATINVLPGTQDVFSQTIVEPGGTTGTIATGGTSIHVMSLYAYNANESADVFIQIFAATPAMGDTPLFTFFCPAGTAIIVGTDFFTNSGLATGNSAIWALSSSSVSYQPYASADDITQTYEWIDVV